MTDGDTQADVINIIGQTIFGKAQFTDELEAADYLSFIRQAQHAEEAARSLLQQTVDAARSVGVSWAAIGVELAMTRQAAQQRFGRAPTTATLDDERWLGPVTAFVEMRELQLAGRQGWHTIEAGWLRHRMVRTATQWEHERLLWPQSRSKYLRTGWQIGCRAFPWIYLIRDTGIPVDTSADNALGEASTVSETESAS